MYDIYIIYIQLQNNLKKINYLICNYINLNIKNNLYFI